jgi:hypothetical protein
MAGSINQLELSILECHAVYHSTLFYLSEFCRKVQLQNSVVAPSDTNFNTSAHPLVGHAPPQHGATNHTDTTNNGNHQHHKAAQSSGHTLGH